MAEKEALAENLRLLYVALTRAKSLCYLFWGNIKDSETSAPAYLFHGFDSAETFFAHAQNIKKMNDEDILSGLQTISAKHSSFIETVELKEASEEFFYLNDENKLKEHLFSGTIDKTWRLSSFSSLVFEKPYEVESSDYDADTLRVNQKIFPEKEQQGIFSFPAGTKAGIFFHDILENIDFTEKDEGIIRLFIRKKLDEYGFELSWEEVVYGSIRNVLDTPLSDGKQMFTFSDITSDKRLNELEFHFPIKKFSLAKAESYDSYKAKGVMKGFIDLIFEHNGKFYIVDWKSNLLGYALESYSQEEIKKTMMEKNYHIQYLIYSVALHRYLSLSVKNYSYETHFGGVFYIFLRGICRESKGETGVFFDKPDKKIIDGIE
ncbi:MAG: PD-(D/E)XK nuclease family protein [Nitrospinae bacterium]|nr:PD-(D/E)XK nuclease family protein [Nitrospinota bacterium]